MYLFRIRTFIKVSPGTKSTFSYAAMNLQTKFFFNHSALIDLANCIF